MPLPLAIVVPAVNLAIAARIRIVAVVDTIETPGRQQRAAEWLNGLFSQDYLCEILASGKTRLGSFSEAYY